MAVWAEGQMSKTKRRRRAWAASAAGIGIGSPRRSLGGQGFSGSGVAEDRPDAPVARRESGAMRPQFRQKRIVSDDPHSIAGSNFQDVRMEKMLIARREPLGLTTNRRKQDGVIFGIVWHNARHRSWHLHNQRGLGSMAL